MNRYLKLVHMEVDRFKYILAGLMSLTLVCQFGAVIWMTMSAVSYRKSGAWRNGGSMDYSYSSSPTGNLSFTDVMSTTQSIFMIPILLSIGVLAIYVFLIWYRDWFGRNTFIYRLLILPTARRHIYFAKLTAILIFIFALVSFQLAVLPVEKSIFNLIVPSDLRDPSYFSDIIYSNPALGMLIPWHFDSFLVYYGIGIIAVIAIFAAILIERSYGRLGILYAILYLGISVILLLFPMFGLGLDDVNGYLYPNEIYTIELVMCVVVMSVSVWLGCRLISKKITV
ncbi:hypothetical protein [Paenibacillus macquariensis]|uniref:ABC-2 family transporter protein n=1 Tax=Paenibacillus macquariensis TaxID=948756 RepID=A0ABY1K7P3_9BACL|nr:hypothetical protein [Paenibacillus macquariensis]MEC0091125.1 hypothetical protein [Paenibacillus macquariensis]OAB33691.1 hypothetical protein PMSM_13775 [Paenibacillus macquariensis subsp. macquariensis]SIR37853.1 hypothetical protein SAMN05421578_11275 [Paenibacillus macquariensis]